ncbi:MAG: glycosyltransferase family 2 protein [Phycisphaerales bacterium]|nr:glycosyltransferase family 2 protein [Phycisphaerales bacterium]MCB9856977.1 glycosyltransferase family 2 protein [Phycisphaerales bacterium]MCB9861896.1 glycosyltransferase family 2 protein [Phycisphaerales bacterium]
MANQVSRQSISVVIPTYNDRGTLHRAVASVFAQRHKPQEIIIVDDASRSPVSIPDYSPSIPLRIIRNSTNKGPGMSRQTGVDTAVGDIVAFLDHDDVWSPMHLAMHAQAYDAEPTSSAAYSLAFTVRDGICISRSPARFPGQSLEALLRKTFIHTMSTFSVKRMILRTIGGFSSAMRVCDDLELYLRLFDQGYRVATVAQFLVRREVDGNNLLSRLTDWANDLTTLCASWTRHTDDRIRRLALTGFLRRLLNIRRRAKGSSRQHVSLCIARCLLLASRSVGLNDLCTSLKEARRQQYETIPWPPHKPLEGRYVIVQFGSADSPYPLQPWSDPSICAIARYLRQFKSRRLFLPLSTTKDQDDRIPLSTLCAITNPNDILLLSVPNAEQLRQMLKNCEVVLGTDKTLLSFARALGCDTIHLHGHHPCSPPHAQGTSDG